MDYRIKIIYTNKYIERVRACIMQAQIINFIVFNIGDSHSRNASFVYVRIRCYRGRGKKERNNTSAVYSYTNEPVSIYK